MKADNEYCDGEHFENHWGDMLTFVYILFWATLFLLFYSYFLYPLILYLIVKLRGNGHRITLSDNYFPPLTLIISAYNEEQVIDKKLKNSVELSYPAEKYEILVVSDASDDNTDKIINEWTKRDSRIRLLRQPRRYGKSLGLNRAVAEARGEVVVFSDANAIYEQNALQELVKYFGDERVGYVVGKALYYDSSENAAVENESLYWRYETMLKELESQFHSVCVGDGAIYAIRRSLYQNLEADDIGDFANPLIIASKGYLGLFNNRAICYENAAGDFDKEFSRKRRIVNRSYRSFKKYIKLFTFRRNFKFIFELFSHKILRWFNWLLIGMLFVSNLFIVLFSPSFFYNAFMVVQSGFVLLSIIGAFFARENENLPIWLYFPYYFTTSHFAALFGLIDNLRGIKYVTWEHVRES